MATYSEVLRGLVFEKDKDSVVSLLRSKEIPKNSLKPLKGLPQSGEVSVAPASPPSVAQAPTVRKNGESNVGLYLGLGLVAAGVVYFYTKNNQGK